MSKPCPTCNSVMRPVGAGSCPTCGQDSDAIRSIFAAPARLDSVEARYKDLLDQLGVQGHDGATAEIAALRSSALSASADTAALAECLKKLESEADGSWTPAAVQALAMAKSCLYGLTLSSIAATVPAGWKFQSADFSVPNSGRVIFMRDAAGQKLWFSLTEEEQDRIPLYVWGEGTTFEAAMEDARKNALAAPVSATEASKDG